MTTLEKAELKYKQAAQALASAVAAAFPVGTRVRVRRSFGYIKATVYSAPSWWSDPTRLGITSLSSGKAHTVDYKDCQIEEVSND